MTSVGDLADADVCEVVQRALAEDLGGAGVAGDRTSVATVAPDARLEARITARAAGVLAGTRAAQLAFALVDPTVTVSWRCRDGARVAAGEVVAAVAGPARSVLAAERTALNLLAHLSGVATETARYVAAVAGYPALIRDTRKTTPGLRGLEKAAVRAGGGHNHRLGLGDALLVKDNHVVAAGSVEAATRQACDAAPRVQVEVDDLAALDAALAAGAPAVLCDNFALGDLAEAVARCHRAPPAVFVEASGGITLATVRAVAATGVDAIAVGAITHSAPALDIALDA